MALSAYVKCAGNSSTQYPDANGVYTIKADGSKDEPDPGGHPFDAKLTFSVEIVHAQGG